MNSRLARWLTGLYPESWRARYGYEFQSFLEAHPANARNILDLAGWAAYEWLLSVGGFKVNRQQRALAWMCFAFLASIAGGINFYWTVADTPLAAAMRQHAALFTSWNLVRGGSLTSLAAIALVGIPVLATILRTAIETKQWSVVRLLAIPVGAAFATLVWLVVASVLTAGHWTPTPWDVTGDWKAPANWPSVSTRWALSLVTSLMMLGGLIASAVSLRSAIRQSDLSKHSRFLFHAPSIALAASVAAMTVGVFSWGWFVEQYAASDFHARNGGLFNSTNFASWELSTIVFVVASAMAIWAAGSALSTKAE